MSLRLNFEPAPWASQSNKLWLIIAVFVFGLLGASAGVHWLSAGSIVIRQGEAYSGPRAGTPRAAVPSPASRLDAPVAGSISSGNVLFYPLCATWIGLGVTMVTLSALSVFRSQVLYPMLSALSCVAFLLLAFGTVAAAIWLGP